MLDAYFEWVELMHWLNTVHIVYTTITDETIEKHSKGLKIFGGPKVKVNPEFRKSPKFDRVSLALCQHYL